MNEMKKSRHKQVLLIIDRVRNLFETSRICDYHSADIYNNYPLKDRNKTPFNIVFFVLWKTAASCTGLRLEYRFLVLCSFNAAAT